MIITIVNCWLQRILGELTERCGIVVSNTYLRRASITFDLQDTYVGWLAAFYGRSTAIMLQGNFKRLGVFSDR
jgi:hypothetical protein